MGLDEVPQAGDTLQVFHDEQKARQIALWRQTKEREALAERQNRVVTLETLHKQIKEGEVNELAVVVKGDVQGSVEVLARALSELSTPEVRVKVIHGATGAITETDIMLAAASRAIVIGFNVRPERNVIEIIRREGVDVRLHSIIYNVTEEIKQAMLATLSPVEKEVYQGRAEVREVFRIAKVGDVAGCYVTDGLIRRDSRIRLLRDSVVVWNGRLSSLKRFKDDAKEVKSGFECGIGLERYNDLKPGDELEAFTIELTRRDSLDPQAQRKLDA
jgi:translation initiation factor IF-2